MVAATDLLAWIDEIMGISQACQTTHHPGARLEHRARVMMPVPAVREDVVTGADPTRVT
jgi:hypothetical protein